MLEKLMTKANEFEMVILEKDNSIYVKDFEGFDENWEEIIVEIPDELWEILGQLKELGVKVRYASEDI